MKFITTGCLCAVVLGGLQATAALAQGTAPMAVAGEFAPLNPFGEGVEGRVSITPQDGDLAISLSVSGVPQGMRLAHIHGFAVPTPTPATCPDAAADANGDGFVDLIETRDQAGVTLIPFTDNPASLTLLSETYPTANDEGRLTWEKTVDTAELTEALLSRFDTPLALETRVVFIHGAPQDADLPDTVQSLEGVPAVVTIPIACAELHPADG